MNDFVRQLVEQTGCPAEQHFFLQCLVYDVVQECVDICRRGVDTQMTSTGAADLIEQRFGVNE
jgi:hypothetical protein